MTIGEILSECRSRGVALSLVHKSGAHQIVAKPAAYLDEKLTLAIATHRGALIEALQAEQSEVTI